MKRLKFHRSIVAIAMTLIGWLPSLAHDFEVDGVFYNKTSDNTVAVTFAGNSYNSSWDEYIGDVVIPSSVNYNGINYDVTSIGDNAFTYCSSLTSVVIGNSVTSIGYAAFYDCDSLTDVVIGNSVTSIGIWTFGYCKSLTSIEIPDSVTNIGSSAFACCWYLTSIEIPNSVTSIGEGAFYKCSGLTSVEIGNSVTSIGYEAFSCCYSLTEIKCWATTPPTIHYDTFSNYSADLYVPIGCKAAYEVANYWKNFNIIEITLDKPITLNDNDVIVATIGDNIVVKNATVGSVVRVYTADGAMIASEVTTDGDVIIEAPAKGIYVVKVGKQTVKVII